MHVERGNHIEQIMFIKVVQVNPPAIRWNNIANIYLQSEGGVGGGERKTVVEPYFSRGDGAGGVDCGL